MKNDQATRLVIHLWVLAVPGISLGDDAHVGGVGGTVHLLKPESASVRLVSETVYAKLPEWRVTARFVFRNEGPAQTILMGFPETAWGDRGRPRQSEFRYFHSWVDGVKVKTRRRPSTVRHEKYRAWWVKRVHFSKGQTRVVENRYQGGWAGWSDGSSGFVYTLATGASWKGRIGHARIVCDIRGLRDFSNLGFSDEGCKRRGSRVIWEFRNFEPGPASDISMHWHPFYMNIWLNGQQAGKSDPSPWPNPPQRDGDDVVLKLSTAARWLQADLRIVRPNRQIKVTRGNRWAVVRVGSRWLRTDAGRVSMPRRARLEDGYTMVTLKPLVKALGGKAHFDRKRNRLVAWIKPPEQAGGMRTNPPQARAIRKSTVTPGSDRR